jgi:hypothetical protein
MAYINFDESQRREYKEPQTTKKELLRPPTRTGHDPDWTAPPSASSIPDFAPRNDSWSFGTLSASETTFGGFDEPVKEEGSSLVPSSDAHNPQSLAGQDRKDSHATDGRGSSTSSDDKYGRSTGVIDLTAEDSDEEQGNVFPERQFIPRAEDTIVARLPKCKSPTPPRTFIRGLSPIAAHPRRAPIVHRSKPPIKPKSMRQGTVSSSPAPPTSHSVFKVPSRSSPNCINERPMLGMRTGSTPVRSLRSTPLRGTTATMGQTTPARGQPSGSSTLKRTAGPFIEDDSDSNSGEEPTPSKQVRTARDSVTRIMSKNPRNDTPTRTKLDEIVEKSRLMREKARLPAEGDHITTIAPDADPDASTSTAPLQQQPSFLDRPRPRPMH